MYSLLQHQVVIYKHVTHTHTCSCFWIHFSTHWFYLGTIFDFYLLQLNDAKFEDIDFFVYTVNDNGAEVETINVSTIDLTHFLL